MCSEQNKTVSTLKDLIKKHGYNQKTFAKALGLQPSSVSGYMTGQKTPSAETVVKICRVLQRPPKEIFQALGIDVDGVPSDKT